MTGQYSLENGTWRGANDANNVAIGKEADENVRQFKDDVIPLPQLLKATRYATGIFGNSIWATMRRTPDARISILPETENLGNFRIVVREERLTDAVALTTCDGLLPSDFDLTPVTSWPSRPNDEHLRSKTTRGSHDCGRLAQPVVNNFADHA